MITDSLFALYIRDLDKVILEINLYEKEENLWKVADGINNSAGNLALHLVGNLKTYIGKNLGGFEYIRDRPAEFALKNIPKAELIEQIESVKSILTFTFQILKMEDLDKTYPENILGYEMTTDYFLFHLLAHLNYHLGQINYHRRLVAKD